MSMVNCHKSLSNRATLFKKVHKQNYRLNTDAKLQALTTVPNLPEFHPATASPLPNYPVTACNFCPSVPLPPFVKKIIQLKIKGKIVAKMVRTGLVVR